MSTASGSTKKNGRTGSSSSLSPTASMNNKGKGRALDTVFEESSSASPASIVLEEPEQLDVEERDDGASSSSDGQPDRPSPQARVGTRPALSATGRKSSAGGARRQSSSGYTAWKKEAEREAEEMDDEDASGFSGPLHYLPLVVAVVPPLGAILHGRAEAWTDALILLIVAFYLYQVVRVPWELYYASRTRRINTSTTYLSEDPTLLPEKIRRRRRAASAELRNQELLSLLLCIISPFLGSYLLYYVRGALSEPERYINPFNVRLFVLASGIKPWSHFVKLVKRRSLFLQAEVHYPIESVTLLQQQVESLSTEIEALKRSFASKKDVRMLRDGIDQPLTELSKALRRYERKEEYMRLSSEEKFSLLAQRQEEILDELDTSAEKLEELRLEQERSGSIVKKLRMVFGPHAIDQEGINGTTGGRHHVWYERGMFFYIFLPVIASTRILNATGRLFHSLPRVSPSHLLSFDPSLHYHNHGHPQQSGRYGSFNYNQPTLPGKKAQGMLQDFEGIRDATGVLGSGDVSIVGVSGRGGVNGR